MQTVINLFIDLKKYIELLEDRFIKKYIPVEPEIGPEEYEQFVKAYCLLSHAAIEEYMEEVVLKVIEKSIDDWTRERKIVDGLLTLISYYGIRLKIDEGVDEVKVFDYLRKMFKEAKKEFSKDIEKNHGIAIINLRRLLLPVGIDIKQDLNLKNSLNKLSSERGIYAHFQRGDRKGAKKVLSPEDAQKYVEDCLSFCEDIKNKALNKFNYILANWPGT